MLGYDRTCILPAIVLLRLCIMISPAAAANRANTGAIQAPAAPQCIVATALGPPWQPPGSFNYLQQITLNITNSGRSIVPVPYSLAVANPAYNAASQAFQWVIQSEAGGIISGVQDSCLCGVSMRVDVKSSTYAANH